MLPTLSEEGRCMWKKPENDSPVRDEESSHLIAPLWKAKESREASRPTTRAHVIVKQIIGKRKQTFIFPAVLGCDPKSSHSAHF